jgi:hypothetical protein
MHISSETNSEEFLLGKKKYIWVYIFETEEVNGTHTNVKTEDHNNHVLIWVT